MSGTICVTFCFDKNYQTPDLKNVLNFLLNNKAKDIDYLRFFVDGREKKIGKTNMPTIYKSLESSTKDFILYYDWEPNENNLIANCSNEILNYFERQVDSLFRFFSIGFLNGACLERHNAVFEEVEDVASEFIIYFYAETNTIIYDSENFEKNLRNNPKIQELISAFEKEFKTKVIKIGVSVSI
jgi:hypothetical protein